jgi:hypothetical protein
MIRESDLLYFYRGNATDSEGRYITDIWAWDDEDLEDVHDYIQWLFPLFTPSEFNPDAPKLTRSDVAVFRSDTDLRDRVLRSLDVMLRFYGLSREGNTVTRGPDFDTASINWLNRGNHNYRRLARILSFLTHIGLVEAARGLLACLEDIADHEGAREVSSRTRQFWSDAVK